MSAIWEVAERVQALTGGVPNLKDHEAMVWHGAVLVVQRHPGNLSRHRVCLIQPENLYKLPQLVAEKWT